MHEKFEILILETKHLFYNYKALRSGKHEYKVEHWD